MKVDGRYADILKPILTEKIEEAVNAVVEQAEDALFPWVGDRCYAIMADAAICVLRGMEDAENLLRDEGLLED